MKKGFLVVLILALICPVFSLEKLDSLAGIWEGKDRFVFFENATDDENPELVIVLKEYYGWYYDRAAEPESYSELEKRTRNAATHKDAEHIPYSVNKLSVENTFEINLQYSKNQNNLVPVAIVDGKMYLNFYTKPLVYDENGKKIITTNGNWRGYVNSEGIKVSPQKADENISLLIIDENKYYDVRYWLSDMDYEDADVVFKYKDEKYDVPKHLISSGNVYSCVTGKSKKVRNPMPYFIFNESDFIFDEDKTILVIDNEPYLTKLTDKKTIDDLMQIIKEANSRRKPDPEPIFPVKLPSFPGE